MPLSEKTMTVVIPATFLFVFGIAVVGWNIVIWKQVSELRDDVYSLTNEMRRNSENYRYLQTRYNFAIRMMREYKLIDRDEVQLWNKQDIPTSVNLIRRKRSAVGVPHSSDESSNSGVATKPIRRKRKNKKRGPRRKGSKPKCKLAGSSTQPTSQNVTAAFHFTSSNSVSYGVITSWRGEDDLGAINFDASQMSTNGKIKVLKSGVYFIYGKVVFSNVRARYQKMAQIVVTNGESEKIFSTCIVLPEQESEFLSCNLSGIKRLTSGQFLYLDISPPTFSRDIYSLRPATNFGGFWIGD